MQDITAPAGSLSRGTWYFISPEVALNTINCPLVSRIFVTKAMDGTYDVEFLQPKINML